MESSFALKVADSPVESSFVLKVAGSPVESSFVPVCSEVSIIEWSPVKSSGVQWYPLESSGVHVDYVGDGKVLVDSYHYINHCTLDYLCCKWCTIKGHLLSHPGYSAISCSGSRQKTKYHSLCSNLRDVGYRNLSTWMWICQRSPSLRCDGLMGGHLVFWHVS